MNRQILTGALDQLGQVLERLEQVYVIEIARPASFGHPANDNGSELSIACEAIEEAINALTRALTNA